ncbi:hypothetical protein ACHAXS_011997 [Conticribra weissflogii]
MHLLHYVLIYVYCLLFYCVHISATMTAPPPPARQRPFLLLLLLYLLLLSHRPRPSHAQQQPPPRANPSEFNGGSVLAMAGRNAIAIATDARFGLGPQTVSAARTDRGHPHGARDAAKRIFLPPDSNAMVAWTGLVGDGTTFTEELSAHLARKTRRAGCLGFEAGNDAPALRKVVISPRAVSLLTSHLLYRRRSAPYYVETVVVGLEEVRVPIPDGLEEDEEEDEDGDDDDDQTGEFHVETGLWKAIESIAGEGSDRKSPLLRRWPSLSHADDRRRRRRPRRHRTIRRPFLCATDMLGARSTSDSFVCSGAALRSLHGTAEALWKPNLEGDELVEVCGKAFLSALERDCLSGYGAVVYLIRGVAAGSDEGDGDGNEEDVDVEIVEYILACRND